MTNHTKSVPLVRRDMFLLHVRVGFTYTTGFTRTLYHRHLWLK